jgi:tungstate ABC transporter binding protein WtpA
MKQTLIFGMMLLVVASLLIAGCTQQSTEPTTPVPTVSTSKERLLLATTTSAYDTGLLDFLEPKFEAQYPYDLQITSQGTGKAIELAKRGDADVLLVHLYSTEMAFLEDGFGLNRRTFAANYFQIVGPASDPAGIKDLTPEQAFTKLRTEGLKSGSNVFFASRGDNSGTHGTEKLIWTRAGYDYATQIQKSGNWYLETGKGMGETITFASEKGAYTLTDEATYLTFRSNLSLVPLVTQGESLINVYSVMAVYPQNPDPKRVSMANDFINFLISPQTMDDIANYGLKEYNKTLFVPFSVRVPPGVPDEAPDFTTPATAMIPLKVYHAGSLNGPMAKLEKAFEAANPTVDVQLFSGGSATLVDKVNKNGKFADVLASADYTLIPKYMMPQNASFYLNFAKNSIVLCYKDSSQFANEITAENWYQVLNREGVKYAISDPTADPAGYRSLMTIQLAEEYYEDSTIFESLIGDHSLMTTTMNGAVTTIDATNPSPDGTTLTITKTGPEIVPLLTAGTVDYAFEYSSVAIQNGLKYISLPEAIDLSSQAEGSKYETVQVKRPAGTETGTPIIYGVTVPASARQPAMGISFVNLLTGKGGQTILSADGQTPIVPAEGYGMVPAAIQLGS